MTEVLSNGVDMSMWGGELTDSEAKEMIHLGIVWCCVGTGWPGQGGGGQYARQQAESWINNGGRRLDAYRYLTFSNDIEAQVQQMLDNVNGLPIGKYWLDVEDTVTQVSVSNRISLLWRAIHFLENKGIHNFGLYSAKWYWNPYMGGTTEFNKYDLWDANYPQSTFEDPFITPWEGRQFGGFREPVIYQFIGTTYVAGQSVDVSWVREMEEDMASLEERLKRVENLVAGYGLKDDKGNLLGGEDALSYADLKQFSLFLGLDTAFQNDEKWAKFMEALKELVNG